MTTKSWDTMEGRSVDDDVRRLCEAAERFEPIDGESRVLGQGEALAAVARLIASGPALAVKRAAEYLKVDLKSLRAAGVDPHDVAELESAGVE